MAVNQAERPQFYEGQYLGAADLEAVVEHGRFQRARHDLGAHTWGIAAGLHLQEQKVAGGQFEVYLLPGYAWDGFGRPIVVLAPYKIPAELFKSFVFDPAIDGGSPAGRLIELWLRYEETPAQSPGRGFERCDSETVFARVQETFRLEVGRRGLADQQDRLTVAGYALYAQEILQQFEPQTPPAVLHDEAVAFQQLSAGGERKRWLIPVGAVRWLPNAAAGQPGSFVKRQPADLDYSRSLRRYIGVVAGAVQAADKNIRLRHRAKPYSTVQSDDLVWAEGSLRVEGDTRLFGGKLEWRNAIGQDQGVPLDIRRASDAGGNTMLQVAIGEATAGRNRFAVGPLKAGAMATDPKVVDEKFVVLDNGNTGIGTTAPLNALHVARPNHLNAIFDRTDTSDHLTVVVGSVGSGLRFSDTNDFFIASQPYADRNSNGFGVEHFRITSTGQVGIGTPNPTGRLTLNGILQPAQGTLTFFSPNADVEYDGGSDGLFVIRDNGGRTAFLGGNIGIGTTGPAEKLDVRGNIKLGASGTLFAMGALQNLRVVVGRVNSNGTHATGDGFSSSRSSTGTYSVTFTASFSSSPIVLATTVNSLSNDNIVTIRNITSGAFEAVITDAVPNGEGDRQDTEFTFIALGTP